MPLFGQDPIRQPQLNTLPGTAELTIIVKRDQNPRQPGLGASGTSLSLPGRLALRDLIGAGNRQIMNVRQTQGVNSWV